MINLINYCLILLYVLLYLDKFNYIFIRKLVKRIHIIDIYVNY